MPREYGHPVLDLLSQSPLHQANNQKLGWAGSGELIVGSSDGNFSVQADFDVPGYYTVQFNLKPPPGLGERVLKTYAEIIWSVAGNAVRRIISVNDGSSISGAGEAIRVTLFDLGVNNTPENPIAYEVSCLITKGNRPVDPNSPPMLLVVPQAATNNYENPLLARSNERFFAEIPTGESQAFCIPDDAGVHSYYFNVVNDTFTAFDASNIKVFNRLIPDSGQIGVHDGLMQNRWLPLPSGCRVVTYANESGDTLLLSHTWGVEG